MTVIVGIDEGKVLLPQEGTGFTEGASGDLRALTQTPSMGAGLQYSFRKNKVRFIQIE